MSRNGMIERLEQRLREAGYHPMRHNVPAVSIYYTLRGQNLDVILIADDITEERQEQDVRLSQWQYMNLYRRITADMEERGYAVRVLGVICTDRPDEAQRFHYEETWILDTAGCRLILYEDQKGGFETVREIAEEVLDEAAGRITLKKRRSAGADPEDFADGKREKKVRFSGRGIRFFSLMNTLMVIANVLVFLIMFGQTENNRYLVEHGALFWPYVIERKEYYRLFTYLFLHSGYRHIVNNMLVLLFVGDNLERAVGRWKYLVIYLGSGILAGVTSMLWNMHLDHPVVCVGASGAIFGVVGALAYIVIINKGRLEDISSRQIFLFVFFSLYGGLTSQGVDNAAHIGGLVTGIIFAAILYRKSRKEKDSREKEELVREADR